MKTTNHKFVFNWVNPLLLAVLIGLWLAKPVKAKNPGLNSLNGLFTPTQAEQFFQAGKDDFAQEVEIFIHPERYLQDDLLEINVESTNSLKQDPKPVDSEFSNLTDIYFVEPSR